MASFHWSGGSKFAKATSASLDLSFRRVSRSGPSCSLGPGFDKRGVGVGDRKAETGMSANEPRRIARRREPMFDAPIVVLGLIAVLIGIYAAFNWAPVAVQDRVIRDYAFIPGRLTIAIWPDRLIDLIKPGEHRPGRAATGATDPGIACAGRRRQAMDGADLCLHARVMDSCVAEFRLAGRLRTADRPPVRLDAVSSVHGGDRNRQRARALGDFADGFLPAHRRVGIGFRPHGRGDPIHVSAGGAARSVRLDRVVPKSRRFRPRASAASLWSAGRSSSF